jgi:hypothetical protein
VKDAIAAATRLVREADEPLRAAVERNALAIAASLGAYDLRHALRRTWLPATDRSPQMARLRLRQAADPQINDRWNASDNVEFCALLAYGPGLAELPYPDIAAAALALTPEHPLAAAEFAEVAWRAARAEDAASIMAAVRTATPDQPAYAPHRLLVDLIHAAAEVDAAAAAESEWADAAARVAAADALIDDSDIARRLAGSATTAVKIRRLLAASDPGNRRPGTGEPAQA